MSFPEKPKAVLMELEQDARLKDMTVEMEPSGSGRFVAIVESPSFDRIADYVRQNLVWERSLSGSATTEQTLRRICSYSSQPLDERRVRCTVPQKPRNRPRRLD